MNRLGRAAVLAAAVALLLIPRDAGAARIALLVGNDEGHAGDPQLRYAEKDATHLAALLGRIGGFAADGVVLALGHTAGEVERALDDLSARLRVTPGDNLIVVYYSGHADGQGLHLGASTLPLGELKARIVALPAATRVLILDACQAGLITQTKGGRPGAGFEVALDDRAPVHGLAILAASAGSELAQESDQLGGSVFTHYLQLGLSGLADRNEDGNVSLGEAFDYASERTVATTLGTASGPQHPTFRLDIQGRDDLILTRPGLSGLGYGQIRLDVPGWYFVRRPDGTLAAEIHSHGREMLALEPGSYEVARRDPGALQVAGVTVDEGRATAISSTAPRPVPFGRMVRKGGGPEAAFGLAVATDIRTPIADLGPAFGLAAAGRVDLPAVSIELRVRVGRASEESARLATTTWEGAVSAAALRVRDFGSLAGRRLPTAGLGLEAGAAYLTQTLDDGERRATVSPFFGPTALAELTVGRHAFIRADLGLPIYLLRIEPASGGTETAWHPALLAAFGGGAWF